VAGVRPLRLVPRRDRGPTDHRTFRRPSGRLSQPGGRLAA